MTETALHSPCSRCYLRQVYTGKSQCIFILPFPQGVYQVHVARFESWRGNYARNLESSGAEVTGISQSEKIQKVSLLGIDILPFLDFKQKKLNYPTGTARRKN